MSRRSNISYRWNPCPIPIKEFIQRYKLPQVVRIHDGENKRFQAPANFNLQQPILLYKVYACRKIHARALAYDDQGNVRPTGPNLIIPDSYQGWLAMVTKDGRTAGFFSSVGEVSRAAVPMFLLQDPIDGLRATSSGLSRTVISGGQIIRAIGPFEDLNRQNLAITNNGQLHPDVMMYLKCMNQQGEFVFLPYSARGRFYCLASPKSYSLNHVFLLTNLLKIAKLPILVRIVSGDKPPISLPLTNIVRLEEVRQEMIILGCTMVDNEPVLLEINANSDFSFVKSSDNQILHNSVNLQRMCQLCTIKGDKWRQQIRVAHHVIPKTEKKCRPSSSLSRKIPSSILSRKIPSNAIQTFPCRIPPGSILAAPHIDYINTVNPIDTEDGSFFKKTSLRGYPFPKKFWMFRKARKFALCSHLSRDGRNDCINTISYSKSKKHKYTTVKIMTAKGAELLIGGEKVRLEVQRFAHSDDGYITSHAEEESIYHSIC